MRIEAWVGPRGCLEPTTSRSECLAQVPFCYPSENPPDIPGVVEASVVTSFEGESQSTEDLGESGRGTPQASGDVGLDVQVIVGERVDDLVKVQSRANCLRS